MSNKVYRLLVEKKQGFNVEGKQIFDDLKNNLSILGLEKVRLINRYDIQNISVDNLEKSIPVIFSEPMVDIVYKENLDIDNNDKIFAIEYLPGQYDQRSDSAMQAVEILSGEEGSLIKSAKVYVLSGNISDIELEKIKKYLINPTDSREAEMNKPETLEESITMPKSVEILEGFIDMRDEDLEEYINNNGLAMNTDDLKMCRNYFKDTEGRNPSITEIKLIDTYWSDHCRHTTFETIIDDVEFEDGEFTEPIKSAFEEYKGCREYVYADKKAKEICFMDLATICMKELKGRDLLKDLEESGEINACSIEIDVDVDGEIEKWLLMFKNETHNHPTEIEPFGGAATCLGGAIRDPLSGRAYVYQAMRITGSGDPTGGIDKTIAGKLPQRIITTQAANGYSSYGNQIGVATGQVREIYDEGFLAKRMELGAVIGAVPKDWVIREVPKPTDVVILLGGRTGRDGCGGATGSSKEHDETSIYTSGAEVQKGNAPTERKILRLFRKPEVTTLIKRCNDFGAGGVSVAIGELASGLEIDLDKVTKKYEGLDGTELAISESQERMAVVVAKEDVDKFIEESHKENLEATPVAVVTDKNRMVMNWRGDSIVDLSRDFLDTNGAKRHISIKVKSPSANSWFDSKLEEPKDFKTRLYSMMTKINNASQKGMIEKFDASVGAGNVLAPLGGKFQYTIPEGMAFKIPVPNGETDTASMMSYGYNPSISKWSPFHGALYAVVESVAKIAAMGGDIDKTRLSFQEYFEKLGKDKEKWGLPFTALLGALVAQRALMIPAIGGKDSMSGTFNELNVPPTLVSFAVSTGKASKIVSPEFKKPGSSLWLLEAKFDNDYIIDFNEFLKNIKYVSKLINEGKVLSAKSVGTGGIARAISLMSFGNKIGAVLGSHERLFYPVYGSIILEIDKNEWVDFLNYNAVQIGKTIEEKVIRTPFETIDINDLIEHWEAPLEDVFPTTLMENEEKTETISFTERNTKSPRIKIAKPKVLITSFPGTNSEYDSERAFLDAGAETEIFVFKNRNSNDINESINKMAQLIKESQIIMIPGGFSAGDEPEGSAKFIATIFRNEKISESISELLNNRDGLMLGICNGFQALIKLGLVPYGEIKTLDDSSPTLTNNKIGRHASKFITTRISSVMSPWMQYEEVGNLYNLPISHGEGRFVASEEMIEKLIKNGQIAAQYVNSQGVSTMDIRSNPNGSTYTVEALTSPDGRVLGKMAHSERSRNNCFVNIGGNKNQTIFKAGVDYFK